MSAQPVKNSFSTDNEWVIYEKLVLEVLEMNVFEQ